MPVNLQRRRGSPPKALGFFWSDLDFLYSVKPRLSSNARATDELVKRTHGLEPSCKNRRKRHHFVLSSQSAFPLSTDTKTKDTRYKEIFCFVFLASTESRCSRSLFIFLGFDANHCITRVKVINVPLHKPKSTSKPYPFMTYLLPWNVYRNE